MTLRIPFFLIGGQEISHCLPWSVAALCRLRHRALLPALCSSSPPFTTPLSGRWRRFAARASRSRLRADRQSNTTGPSPPPPASTTTPSSTSSPPSASSSSPPTSTPSPSPQRSTPPSMRATRPSTSTSTAPSSSPPAPTGFWASSSCSST